MKSSNDASLQNLDSSSVRVIENFGLLATQGFLNEDYGWLDCSCTMLNSDQMLLTQLPAQVLGCVDYASHRLLASTAHSSNLHKETNFNYLRHIPP